MGIFVLRRYLLICLFLCSVLSGGFAQDTATFQQPNSIRLGKHVQLNGLFYLAGKVSLHDSMRNFAFLVRRAYITIKADLTRNLLIRYTQDLTLDREGGHAGNIALRIKYLYAQYKIPSFWIFSHNSLKFGVIQCPWLDFEEHINAYRVQGTMFMERSRLFNSSGFGLSFQGFIGGKLTGGYVSRVHPHDAGKYGSFIVGIYNGGGYHQFEKNLNKNFEVRITLRPFPEKIPGLQLSYTGLFGKGNTPESPEFYLNAVFVSFQGQYLTMTAQYEKGRGNSYGTMTSSSFRALPHRGYSFYSEFKIPKTRFAIYERFDHFAVTNVTAEKIDERQLYGASWRFFKENKLVFTFQKGSSSGKKPVSVYDLALDISF
jgi:hypothetical protein